MRTSAVDALGNLGKHAAPAGPALIKCLEDTDGDVRSSAAAALGKLGKHAASAVWALTMCLADENPDVRRGGS